MPERDPRGDRARSGTCFHCPALGMNEGGRGPRAAAMLQYPARRHPRLSGGANGGSAIREADANRPPDSSIVAARTGPTGRGTGGKRATVATPGRPMAQGSKRSVGKRMESSVRSQAEGFRYGSHRVLESRGDARGGGQEAFAIAMPVFKKRPDPSRINGAELSVRLHDIAARIPGLQIALERIVRVARKPVFRAIEAECPGDAPAYAIA